MESHNILFESLDKAEQHFEAGEIRLGQKMVSEVSRGIKSAGKISNKLKHKFNFMSAQSRYYNEISSFAANPKRNEIIDAVKALIEKPIDEPKKQANAIHGLQTKWQLLDQSSKPADRVQWSEFKQLTDKAWEPCAQYYEELKAVKLQNAAEREKIIQSIADYAKDNSAKWPGLIQMSRFLNQAYQTWQTFAPVMDEDFVRQKSSYQAARKPINDAIRSEESKNYKLKESIINKVKAINDEDTQECIFKFKKLKREYQDIGPAGKKNEQVLWKMLNENADRFFAAEKSITDEELKTIDALLTKLKSDDFQLNEIKESMRDLNKTRKTPEFTKLQKAIKTAEIKNIEAVNSKKADSYKACLNHLESEAISDTVLHSDIRKSLMKPSYKGDLELLHETVVMMELIAGIETPAKDQAIKQKLTLQMLQDKFSEQRSDSDKLKDLMISFINNLSAKNFSAAEKKLVARFQDSISGLSKQLP